MLMYKEDLDINHEIPFGPKPSIVFSSPFFQKRFAILKKDLTKIILYNSSTYHLFFDIEYNGSKL